MERFLLRSALLWENLEGGHRAAVCGLATRCLFKVAVMRAEGAGHCSPVCLHSCLLAAAAAGKASLECCLPRRLAPRPRGATPRRAQPLTAREPGPQVAGPWIPYPGECAVAFPAGLPLQTGPGILRVSRGLMGVI